MRCKQKREQCVFNRDGKCDILDDTNFTRPCPFYKERPPEILLEKYFDGELFRSIKGFNGKYFVSENGKIVTCVGRPVAQTIINGRPTVQLVDYETRSRRRKSVAVIVADAFIAGTGVVGFRDGNWLNCERWNLYRKGDEE